MINLKMRQIEEFFNALSFLTIIPIKTKNKEIFSSVKFFPLVGFLIGIFLYFISYLPILDNLKAFLILFFWEFITGFFHLDGLADTSDAIFSSKMDKEVLFKIMKDSNIGVMGACMLFFVLSGKYLTILEALKISKSPIILAPIIGRFSINYLSWKLPYAKKEGLGKLICEKKSNNYFFISLISTFLIISMISWKYIFSFFVIIIFLNFYGKYFKKKFGGVTGDIFGFSVETIELIFLFMSVII